MGNWRGLVVVILGGLVLLGCDRSQSGGGLVDDRAGLLGPAEVKRLEALQGLLERDFAISLRLVILDRPSIDIDTAAGNLFEDFGRRDPTRSTRTLLLLIDPRGGQVRMEVGYDLEGIYPDAFVGYIEDRQMVPFFVAARVADGVAATVELLVDRAFGTGNQHPPDSPPPLPLRHAGGGAGARSAVTIGGGTTPPRSMVKKDDFPPQPTPLGTLGLYRRILRDHLKESGLGLYTPETRQFLHRWLVTDAQQDNELRALLEVWNSAKVIINGPRAVVRFPLEARRNPPYFLCRREKGWQLDLAAMNRLVGFNHRNQWHFRNLGHGYMFAFADWQFDNNGIPHRKLEGW